jgi:hypothetical protein
VDTGERKTLALLLPVDALGLQSATKRSGRHQARVAAGRQASAACCTSRDSMKQAGKGVQDMHENNFDVAIRITPEIGSISIAVRTQYLEAVRAAMSFPTAAFHWRDDEPGWKSLIIDLDDKGHIEFLHQYARARTRVRAPWPT